MNYYKIMKGSEYIGVSSSFDLRRYQLKHKRIMACNEDLAEYICFGNLLYHDTWMAKIQTDAVVYENAEVSVISKERYEALYNAKNVEDIIPEEPDTIEEEPEQDPDIEYIRDMKIMEMSKACHDTIVNGFDLDGKHYSLTIEDQMEIQNLMFMASSHPYNHFSYHADGEQYGSYSAEKIGELYDKMIEVRDKHRMYFNKLKHYIMSLDDMNEISNVKYGMEIPEGR